MALFRAAQEGLTNVQKHSNAKNVQVNVRLGPQTGLLAIKDDGEGFEHDSIEGEGRQLNAGYGLRGLRERLELVRGRLLVHSLPGKGTEVIVTVPKNPLVLIANE
jgi:two-component system sensor histidine kinase DegS